MKNCYRWPMAGTRDGPVPAPEQDRHVFAGQVVCPGEVEQLQNENDHDDGERNVLPHKRGMGRENRAQQIKGRREHDAEPRAAAGVEPRKGPCAAPCDERQLDEQEAEHRSVHAAQKGGRLKHDPHAKRVEHGMVVRKAVVPVPAGIMGRPQNLIDHVVGIDGAESGEVGQKDEDERGLQQGEADEPEPWSLAMPSPGCPPRGRVTMGMGRLAAAAPLPSRGPGPPWPSARCGGRGGRPPTSTGAGSHAAPAP